MIDKNYEFFMKTDMSHYLGKWVAICDERIISSGDSAKKVFEDAKKSVLIKNHYWQRFQRKIQWYFNMTIVFRYKSVKRPDGTLVKTQSIPIILIGKEVLQTVALLDSGADISL